MDWQYTVGETPTSPLRLGFPDTKGCSAGGRGATNGRNSSQVAWYGVEMSGSRKQQLAQEAATEQATTDERELYLRDGRRIAVREESNGSLVEVRSPSGQVEVRIMMTEKGPVLQMESVRLQLKAEEAIELESPTVAIKGEEVRVHGGTVAVESEADTTITAEGEVRVRGKMIHLN